MVYREKQWGSVGQGRRIESEVKNTNQDDSHNQEELVFSKGTVEFQTAIANATAMTEKKRTYFSNYGFQNVREVLLGEDKQLVENPQNFDKFYVDAVVKKWKKMATKRYNKLKECGSLRTEL